MVTGNVFQILIDLKNSYWQFYWYDKKGFTREEPVERVDIAED